MKNYQELDGERIDMDGIGDVTNMIALSAAQNIGPGIFDGDNFYPADGDYSDASGRSKRRKKRKGTIWDKDERAKRRAERQDLLKSRVSSKNEEIKSRAELNRNIGKENQGDVELAKVLSASAAPLPIDTAPISPGMTRKTKILIGAGAGLVVLIIGIVLYKRYKK
jgi:hypothetical protein